MQFLAAAVGGLRPLAVLQKRRRVCPVVVVVHKTATRLREWKPSLTSETYFVYTFCFVLSCFCP